MLYHLLTLADRCILYIGCVNYLFLSFFPGMELDHRAELQILLSCFTALGTINISALYPKQLNKQQ